MAAGLERAETSVYGRKSAGSVIYASIRPTVNYNRWIRALEVPCMQMLKSLQMKQQH